jgi:hypothetical protein
MSGGRAKAIRREFRRIFGRAPKRAGWSEPFMTKHQYRTSHKTRLGEFFGKVRRFLVRNRTLHVQSEWRQVKRAWKLGGLHALESGRW